MKKWKDPIVEEIHHIRAKIAKDANYDIYKIFEDARARQAQNERAEIEKSIEEFKKENFDLSKIKVIRRNKKDKL